MSNTKEVYLTQQGLDDIKKEINNIDLSDIDDLKEEIRDLKKQLKDLKKKGD